MNRRKKILEISILVIMSSLIVTIIFFAFKQKRNQEMAIRHINDMPSFQFKKINGVSISDRDLVTVSQRIVINFFSPICDHSQNMATQYFKNK